MAANITSSFFFMHPNLNPIKKSSKSVLMLANKDSPNTSSSLIRVGSPIKIKKVFEDKSRGIMIMGRSHVKDLMKGLACIKVLQDFRVIREEIKILLVFLKGVCLKLQMVRWRENPS
ncbi:hypothetical protein M8C21_001830 [Ambrosia artemisiifolia]|uniref:Uncharacterized protein n=1 Tax=Ambrosia artemisiifolia TaxID=4212 RepID=A0AAD5G4S6_AMBAR|nr:hypothetical protein M8C21_001830 [Ambrosia artemisiifolia]